MESDASSRSSSTAMSATDLVSLIKEELAADDERQALVTAAGAGEVPRESQTGATLDLSHMNIGLFPPEAIVLIKDKVERLALSHSPRIELPMAMVQCDRLRYLNLRWNRLTYVPEAVFTLSKLEILDISKNAIISISEDIKKMTGLKFLAASRNKLTRLPLALGEINLVKLKFDDNPIEFPPLDALKPPPDREPSMMESERDKDVCQRVKKFMKAAAARERLRANSEDDLSESNVETPRAPKRSVTGGRFPVRPSISGMDQFSSERKGSSTPDSTPPIPQRSHARDPSSNASANKRPGITPLLINNSPDATRTRSDTVATTSADFRSRRQGFVPRKDTYPGAGNVTPFQFPGHPASMTDFHTREPNSMPNFTFLNVGNGETSPGLSSPVETPVMPLLPRKGTRNTPRNESRTLNHDSVRAFHRLLALLTHFHRPLTDVAQQIQTGSPKRSLLDRHLESAHLHIDELTKAMNTVSLSIETSSVIEPSLVRTVIMNSVGALRSYGQLALELRRKSQQIVKIVDPFSMRCAVSSAQTISIEARHVCSLLGFRTRSVAPHEVLQLISALTGRFASHYPNKSVNSLRGRGMPALPTSTNPKGPRGKPAPIPLSNNFNRSNTMVPQSAVVPPTHGAYGNFGARGHAPSRSNTVRNVTTESETDDAPDKVYVKLRTCCDITNQTLPAVLNELAARARDAENAGQARGAHHFFVATNKCDALIATSKKILTRLPRFHIANPVRMYPQLKDMTELITKDWTDFGTEIVTVSRQNFDLGGIKQKLKPLQYAVKDANRAVQSLALHVSTSGKGPVPISAGFGSFSPDLDSNVSPLGSQGGLPMPLTPLGAALGPAVQATVANTSKGLPGQPDYMHHPPQSATRERGDTYTQPFGPGRR